MTETNQVIRKTLEYSRKHNYVGWDKHDGLSSKLLDIVPFDSKILNLFVQESIKRSPLNVRPFFCVEQRPSPMGLSLFSIANLNMYELNDDIFYRKQGEQLLDRVISHNVLNNDKFALYHNHELQRLSKKIPCRVPEIVATSFAVKALIRASEYDEKYFNIAKRTYKFIVEDLLHYEDHETAKVIYKITDDGSKFIINANALAARVLLDLYSKSDEKKYLQLAQKLLNYVRDQQYPNGGWKYADPPSESTLSMDNYHNGFILEPFIKYEGLTNSKKYSQTIEDSINFHRKFLFEKNGAPNWDENCNFPRDIHASAQGLITFNLAGYQDLAQNIARWAIENLYSNGRFYYQKERYYTKKIILMRWCQAWMSYGLTEHIRMSK